MAGVPHTRVSWGEGSSAEGRPPRPTVDALFEWLSPGYDSAVNVYSFGQDLRWKRRMIAGVAPRRGDRALDLACGTGLVLGRLARQLGAGQVVGLDMNRTMLRQGAGPGRRLVQANAEHLPFPDATFDVITAGYLLKYVDLGRFGRELRRVLRPGGRFGAYDFSRPRHGTVTGQLYAGYLHSVLPRLATTFGRDDPGWRAMMEFLGGIAERSGWEERVRVEFESVGLTGVKVVPSLGGAVSWAWASRPAA